VSGKSGNRVEKAVFSLNFLRLSRFLVDSARFSSIHALSANSRATANSGATVARKKCKFKIKMRIVARRKHEFIMFRYAQCFKVIKQEEEYENRTRTARRMPRSQHDL
jgi:hypothetical protein